MPESPRTSAVATSHQIVGSAQRPPQSVLLSPSPNWLQFKEKDELSEVLRGYSRSADFHMDAAWEWRCRKYYGERYDHLRNLVDWDYHMRLVAADERASIVNFRQWREWRATGVAFEIRDSNFTEPNRTLLSTAVGRTVEFRDRNGEERGRSVSTRGLYCDLLCSPYLTLGVDCAETFLFKKANKQHVKTACDIAEFNLTALWHELYHAEKLAYVPTAEEAARFKDTDDDGTAAAAAEVPAAAPAEPKLTPVNEDGDEDGDEEDAEVAAAAARALAAAARFKVKLVTGDLDKNVLNKGGFKGAFDVVTLGMTMTHRVKEGGGLGGVAKAEGVLAMEDARFWMCLTKEQEAEFRRRVDELAVEAGWKPLGECVGVAPEHHLFSR
jgi:dynein assembly factor 3